MDRTTFENKYKTANFTGEVTATTSRGTSFTGYGNQKVVWQGELSDAARMTMYFMDSVDVRVLPEKSAQYIVNYRNYYPLGASIGFESSEFTDATSRITNYGTNHIDRVIIAPTPYQISSTVTNYGDYINMRDLLRDKTDELSYALTDLVDNYIAKGLSAAYETSSTVSYATQLYGGSGVYNDYGLTAGCILTPSLINEAEVLLSGKYAHYWNSSTFTKSSGVKNPWKNEPTDPFVLIIGPRQKQGLRDSGQFINASQYGERSVISSGEIGDYLGIRVICSNNVPTQTASTAVSYANGYVTGNSTYYNSTTTTLDGKTSAQYPAVDISRCFLMKGRAAYTFVWGRTPTFIPWEQGWTDMRGITLVSSFAGSIVHADAIVKIDVSDA